MRPIRIRWFTFALVLLSMTACVGDGETEDDGAESLTTLELGLHSGGGTLPWRGNIPTFPGSTSAKAGVLGVVYAVDVGMTRVCSGGVLGIGQECHHELRGVQVWSYSPKNADNLMRAGDQTWSAIVGQSQAGSWTRRTCPAGKVVSGYEIWARSNRIEKLAPHCRDIKTGTETTFGPPIGSTSLLFSESLSCGDYVGSLQANTQGDGLGATCVKK